MNKTGLTLMIENVTNYLSFYQQNTLSTAQLSSLGLKYRLSTFLTGDISKISDFKPHSPLNTITEADRKWCNDTKKAQLLSTKEVNVLEFLVSFGFFILLFACIENPWSRLWVLYFAFACIWAQFSRETTSITIYTYYLTENVTSLFS